MPKFFCFRLWWFCFFLDLKLKLPSQSYDHGARKCHRGTPTFSPYSALASHFFDQKCVTLSSIRGGWVPRCAKMPPWDPYSVPLYLDRLWTDFSEILAHGLFFKWVKTHLLVNVGNFSSKMTHLTCIMVLFYRAPSFSFSILMILFFFGPKI